MDECYEESIFNSLSVVKQTPSQKISAEIMLRAKPVMVEIQKEKNESEHPGGMKSNHMDVTQIHQQLQKAVI